MILNIYKNERKMDRKRKRQNTQMNLVLTSLFDVDKMSIKKSKLIVSIIKPKTRVVLNTERKY